MSFLVPLYLAGIAAIAIPIYLHLRRKPPKDSVEFSSLMFLEPTKHQPLKRRSQLENIPLLLLRCLALILLAAMFGRPFMKGGDAEGSEGRMRTVVLLDTSASMKRTGLWEAALEEANDAISKVKGDGALAVIAADGTPRTISSFQQWADAEATQRKDIAKNALATLKPGWSGSDLGSGLIAAAEMLADASADDEAPRPNRIVVVSDLQSGAALNAVADASWPASLKVEFATVEAEDTNNIAISAAATADPKKPVVRLRNDPESEVTRFEIVAGEEKIAAVVPAGESRVFQLEKPASEISVTGDAHDYDNTLFLAPREPAPLNLLFLGAGKPDDSNRPEYYFRRAFGQSEFLSPRFVENFADDPAIVAISRPLDKAEATAVSEFVTGGGRAVLLLASDAMADTLGHLAGLASAPALKEHDQRYALLEQIDFDHPVLSEFRDPRWRDFTEVHFWRYRKLDASTLPEDANVVASFDTGDPAWIDIPVGNGSLLVMTAGWHPRDSQLSLSSKFVPLLFSIFSDRGPQVTGARQFFVGDPLPLEVNESKLTLPDGAAMTLAEGEEFRPGTPGVYRVTDGQRTRSFAVNLRPSESELTPLGMEPLAALGVPVADTKAKAAATAEKSTRHLRDKEAEANQNLWRWAVVILLGMLVAESLLATRHGRTEILQPEGATS